MDDKDIIEILKRLEHKVEFMSRAYTLIHNNLVKGSLGNFLDNQVKIVLDHLNISRNEINDLVRSENQFREEIRDFSKFISKHICDIEEKISNIEKDIEKRIRIKFSVDEDNIHHLEQDHTKISSNKALIELLNTLDDREQFVLIHRLGLKGEVVKSFQAISNLLGIKSREGSARIFNKAIRKCRNESRKKYIDLINNHELNKAIYGS